MVNHYTKSLTHFSRKDDKLIVSGWHTTTDLSGQVARYVILMDSAGNELTRQEVDYIGRPDVAGVFPGIQVAGSSGFYTEFIIPKEWEGKTIYAVSRYASQSGGNGTVSDYWFRRSAILI